MTSYFKCFTNVFRCCCRLNQRIRIWIGNYCSCFNVTTTFVCNPLLAGVVPLFLSHTRMIYMLLSCYCLLYKQHKLHQQHESSHRYNNFINFLISQNKCHYTLSRLYIGITISRSSLLIFYMHDLNGTLFQQLRMLVHIASSIISFNSCSSFYNNIRISIVTQIRSYHQSFEPC